MKYIYVVFVLFLISCNNNESIKHSFKFRCKLSADKVVTVENLYIKYPKIYNLTDSTLLIVSPTVGYSSDKYLIYIVLKESGKIIKTLGPEGKGPRELMGVNNISTLDNEILFYDATSRKILRYNYTNDSARVQILKFQRKSFLRNLYLINDNQYLSSGLFDKYMYSFGSIITSAANYYLEYPELPGISKEKQTDFVLARSYAYMGQMIKHPNLSKFVYYTGTAEYLQIIKLEGEAIKEIMHLNFIPPRGKVIFRVDAYVWAADKRSPACFIGGTASNKYIYLLYSGKTYDNYGFEKGKYVMIFDWHGNKIKLIELDKEVYGITVDNEDKEIFAFTINSGTLNYDILRYTL